MAERVDCGVKYWISTASCRRSLVVLAAFLAVGFSVSSGSAAEDGKTLEVQAFRGGYGLDFFQKAAKEYEGKHPGVKITVDGNPRVWEQLIPRFADGTPPDLTWPGWGMNIWPLVFEGQLLPFDKWLDGPADGSKKTWRQTFSPNLLVRGQYKGKTYILPYNIDAYGIWYNKALFDQHGWKAPATYEELLPLCEKIKAAHIAPLTFTGRYPMYLLNGIYYPWVISIGGLDGYKNAQNLVPGAWKAPAFLEAAKRIMEMKKLGNFEAGCVGMNHTESQMELLVGRAAMIPCGTWLHAEMENLIPKGFEMTYMKTPVFANGKGDPTLIYASADGKGWVIPTKGHNHELAADFYRYLSSPAKAKEFIETKGTLMSVIPETELHPPPHLVEPLKCMKEAKSTWATEQQDWYPAFETLIENSLKDMYNEMITPEQFVDILENGAAAVRNDPSITKMKVQ
jgi:N-acetylglucosamine transport system substrate-binding protein